MSKFSPELISKIWKKAKYISGEGEGEIREDISGARMQKSSYGLSSDHGIFKSKYSWEIDHIFPKVKEGGDEEGNLQPLFWQNNRTKGDNFPKFKTSYTWDSKSNSNIPKEQYLA